MVDAGSEPTYEEKNESTSLGVLTLFFFFSKYILMKALFASSETYTQRPIGPTPMSWCLTLVLTVCEHYAE